MMEPGTFKKNFAENRLLHVLIIILLGLAAYSNTMHSPFQWDELELIVENPVVRDFGYFAAPSKAKGLVQYGSFINRYVGFLTFWANYKAGGFNVQGYHAFNTAVHLANALLIYLLVVITFKSPFLAGSKLREHSKPVAFLGAALFVSHPLQTEAVTYILQRFASLAAFFYIASVTAYAASRISEEKSKRYLLYAVSIISAVLAMKTKENAFTLPLVIVLYEFSFLSDNFKRRALRLLPLLLTMLIIPLTQTGLQRPVGELMGVAGQVSRGFEGISRADYLMTEFSVIVTYLKLLVLPVGQTLIHDQPVYGSLTEPAVFLSLALIISLLALAVFLFFRSTSASALSGNASALSGNAPALRLISFGVFWFFIALSVESSVRPLNMPINEYRAYLPSAGFFLALSTAAALVLMKIKSTSMRTALTAVLLIIPLALTGTAYARNRVWVSEISLWEDVVKKNPGLAYGRYNLGVRYQEGGQTDRAIKEFKKSLALRPGHAGTYVNLSIAFWQKGRAREAERHLKLALAYEPENARAHYNLGLLYLEDGRLIKARHHFSITLRLKPTHRTARGFIAYIDGGGSK